MGAKLSVFQYVVLGIFIALFVGGVFAISQYEGDSGEVEIKYDITIWGPPFPSGSIRDMLTQLRETTPTLNRVSYKEINRAALYVELLEAIANGTAPDLVLVDSTNLLSLREHIVPIPYTALPLSEYRATYVQAADPFAMQDGIYALPVVVDPLVLYWNRDIFSNALVAQVPQDWDTFVSLVPKLSIVERGTDVVQTAIAFGEYDNVQNAKEILSALFFQTGAEIVSARAEGGLAVDLSVSDKNPLRIDPSLALRFYTDFSNPSKKVYSWNKSSGLSRDMFASGKAAMYAGMVTEVATIMAMNPNLNFDLATWPQSATGKHRATYGKVYGLAAMKKGSAKQPQVAQFVAQLLSGKAYASHWSATTGAHSPRRDSLAEVPTDPLSGTRVSSALLARSWLEPGSSSGVDAIFEAMIESVISGNGDTNDAVGLAQKDLKALLSGAR